MRAKYDEGDMWLARFVFLSIGLFIGHLVGS